MEETMTDNNADAPAPQAQFAVFIRDKDGRPSFGQAFHLYPPEARAAFLAQMTDEERKEFADDTGN